MATVVLAREFQKNLGREGSLKKPAWELLRTLIGDDDRPISQLRTPPDAKDPRARTLQVGGEHKAVLFALGTKDSPFYVLATILPNIEAANYAARVRMRLNPANGICELLHDDVTDESTTEFIPSSVGDRLLGRYRAEELSQLGILPELARRAVTVGNEEELERLCSHAPSWQVGALLDLAAGIAIEEVRATYGPVEDSTTERSVPVDVDDPTQLRNSLAQVGTQMEFVLVRGDEHLRRMIEGDFAAWRTFLHPVQRDLVTRARKGSYRVTGGAGTGKTVVAIHRAVALAESSPGARILLTTYTKTLAGQLSAALAWLADPEVRKRITVQGVDQLAREVVARSRGGGPQILQGRDELRLWRRTVDNVPGLSAADRAVFTPYFLTREHERVVLAMGITDIDRYLASSRRGRKVRLSRLQKVRLWHVTEEFVRQLEIEGKTTFARVAAAAAEIAHSPRLPISTRYDHVVVDEGQDLSPAHWRLLRGVVPVGENDLFICEDGHQRIYGDRLVLRNYGIRTAGSSRRLTLNYRMTRQVLAYATRILDKVGIVDLEDEDESTNLYRSPLAGPSPVIHHNPTWREEKVFVVRLIKEWLAESPRVTPSSIAVLAYQQDRCDELLRALQAAAVRTVSINATAVVEDDEHVQIVTMHSAKGTEFARCIVAGVDAETLPSRPHLTLAAPEERAEIELRDRCLLYVACTRARDRLVITWSGEPSSFLP